jgi:hypothetical protein
VILTADIGGVTVQSRRDHAMSCRRLSGSSRSPSGVVLALLGGVALWLPAGAAAAADQPAGDAGIDAKSFRCITRMTAVRHFYVDNLRGDVAATVAAANAPNGAAYPPGSVAPRSASEDSWTSSTGSAGTAARRFPSREP